MHSGSIVAGFFGDFGDFLFGQILTNDTVMASIFFILMVMGFFTIFRSLLRFFFARGGAQFKRKEIDVISFMLSFMGVGGIVFLFDGDARDFVGVFGGTAGLLIVVFFSILVSKFFFTWADTFEDERLKKLIKWTGITLGLTGVVAYLIWVISELTAGGFLETIFAILFELWILALIILLGLAIWALSSFASGKKEGEDGDVINRLGFVLSDLDKEINKANDYMNKMGDFLNRAQTRPSDIPAGSNYKDTYSPNQNAQRNNYNSAQQQNQNSGGNSNGRVIEGELLEHDNDNSQGGDQKRLGYDGNK